MRALDWLKAPLWLAGVAGSEKSFKLNPILGSRRLNEFGLNRARVAFAARMAARRRRVLGAALAPEDRAAFDRDGYVVKRGFLPPAVFARLVERLHGQLFEAREMRQCTIVTRMIPLAAGTLPEIPEAAGVLADPAILALMRYVASTGGRPVYHLQTVIAEADGEWPDPQTELHADTFHPTAKLWLFLQDVGENDGPFQHAPGLASPDPRPPRVGAPHGPRRGGGPAQPPRQRLVPRDPGGLAAFGDGEPRWIAVAANTLVVADTYGFHARTPSMRPTQRLATGRPGDAGFAGACVIGILCDQKHV